MKNKVQLITYVDRLGGGNVVDLHRLLQGPLAGLFGAVHLLPFYYPVHGADAGFDPIDHTQVDPCLGSWADVKALGQEVDLMADLIVNHVSSASPQPTLALRLKDVYYPLQVTLHYRAHEEYDLIER